MSFEALEYVEAIMAGRGAHVSPRELAVRQAVIAALLETWGKLDRERVESLVNDTLDLRIDILHAAAEAIKRSRKWPSVPMASEIHLCARAICGMDRSVYTPNGYYVPKNRPWPAVGQRWSGSYPGETEALPSGADAVALIAGVEPLELGSGR